MSVAHQDPTGTTGSTIEAPASSYDCAKEYAESLWDEAYGNQELNVFCSVNHFIDSRLEEKKRAGWVRKETMNMWATQLDNESRDRGLVLTNLSQAREIKEKAYMRSRATKGLEVYTPRFTIDPTQPQARLDIQKRYDVGREAYFMTSSNATLEKVKPYCYQAHRRYYKGLPELPAEFSYLQELQDVKAAVAGDTVFVGQGLLARVPQKVADLAGVQVNGLPEDEAFLTFGRDFACYRKIEEFFSEEWKELSVADAPDAPAAPSSQYPLKHYDYHQPHRSADRQNNDDQHQIMSDFLPLI